MKNGHISFHCTKLTLILSLYFYHSGKIHHTDVIRMMRSLNPPMGWGKLCPQLTAYKVKIFQYYFIP